MTTEAIQFVNLQRFESWEKVFTKQQTSAIVCVGISHHGEEKEVNIIHDADLSDAQAIALLTAALKVALKRQIRREVEKNG